MKASDFQIEMQRADGAWVAIPDTLCRAFEHPASTLVLMQAFDTGWTGIMFPVKALGRTLTARVYSGLEHVVDVSRDFMLTLE